MFDHLPKLASPATHLPGGPSESHGGAQGRRRWAPGWGQGTLEKIKSKSSTVKPLAREPRIAKIHTKFLNLTFPAAGRGWEAARGREGRGLEAPRPPDT